MNNKFYVGQNAASFKDLGDSAAVEGVILVVDEEHQYTAGNPDGYVWKLENPFGTQQMADDIFAALKGKFVKGYQAGKAALPPEAELGDGVTIDGNYGQMAYRQVKFGPSHYSDISAPLEGDTAHEYQQNEPRETREMDRKIARTRSYIDKKADEIRIGVENDVDGKLAEVSVSLEGITNTVKGQGESISTLQQTANSLSVEINGENGVKGQLSLKVDKNDNNQVVSMLNIATDELNIKNNRFVLDSDNFKVSADGTVTMTGAEMTNAKVTSNGNDRYVSILEGQVKATSGNWIGQFIGTGIYFDDDASENRYAHYDVDSVTLKYGDTTTIITSTSIITERIIVNGVSLNGEWREIVDGSGNKVTVFCKAQ